MCRAETPWLARRGSIVSLSAVGSRARHGLHGRPTWEGRMGSLPTRGQRAKFLVPPRVSESGTEEESDISDRFLGKRWNYAKVESTATALRG